MEVHHHPHVEKKKFKEYFLEFVMIFLAVTLGFIAENIREGINERAEGKQYIQSLIEDLESDTTRMNDIIRFDEAKITALNSMYQCYDSVTNNLKATSCMGILVKYSKVNRPFILNDRTLTQLANAGGYRLLEKEDADSILAYERMYRNAHDFETTVYQEAQDNVRNTLNELANFKVISPLQNVSSLSGTDTGRSSLQGQLLFSDDRTLLNKWFNQLQLYLRVTKAQSALLNNLLTKATCLIHFYKSKYHLK
jgi:predicted metal-binding transcription factor (methanogenesis marker protein 9)